MNYPFLTQKERDVETGLDYFLARYYSSTQGRFSSPDPLLSSGRVTEPQSWNRYNYCSNNPLNIIDPTGLDWWYLKDSEKQTPVWFDQDPGTDHERWTNTFDYVYYDSAAGKYAVLDPTSNFAFTTNTLERANELFDTYFAGWLGMGGQAEGEFLGGLGAGASPFGIFIDQINASAEPLFHSTLHSEALMLTIRFNLARTLDKSRLDFVPDRKPFY